MIPVIRYRLGRSLGAAVLFVLAASWMASAAPPEDDPFAPANSASAAKAAKPDDNDDPFAPSNAAEVAKPAPTPSVAEAKTTGKRPGTAERIDFRVTVEPQTLRRGEVAKLTIRATPRPGFHTYPIAQRTEDQSPAGLSSLKFDDLAGLKLLGGVRESAPEFVDTKVSGIWLEYDKPFTWSQDLLVPTDAAVGAKTLRFQVRVQVCDEKSCLWGDHPFEVALNVSDAPALDLTAEVKQQLSAKPEPIKVVPIPASMGGSRAPKVETAPPAKEAAKIVPIADRAEDHKAGLDAVLQQLKGSTAPAGEGGLLAFMLAGVFWGAVSLVTPCVFPMIPITVSFFLKQSEAKNHRPVAMALVYCATIIIVLTISAVALLSFFRWLSVNPIMNFGLGALFIFFALSLFGMYEIQLPQGLAQYTMAREGQGGMTGTIFMALTFTIVSFACVAPFLGGFGGTAANSSLTIWHRILGGAAFATTFAAPFFVLALFPTLLRRMPKSGSWLNSVKVVMGFLELAAALKFFRAGELVLLPKPVLFTYDLVLGIWIALCLLCGLYLLNVYRLPHDDEPVEHISVPRMLFSCAFLGLSMYLLPASFKVNGDGDAQRPNGKIYAWVDSFLLPEPTESKGELAWSGNLKQVIDNARAEAQQTGKKQLIFVDFTGETCTNCKLNERDVFTKPDIRELFAKYHLVQLFTDKVPDKYYSAATRASFGGNTDRQRQDAEANLKFQKPAFNTETLPTYVILEPRADGTVQVLGMYPEAKINNEAAFAEFLKKPLQS